MQMGRADSEACCVDAGPDALETAEFWVRTILPFARYFGSLAATRELFAPLSELDPDARLPALAVGALLEQAVAITGDRAAGLKVGRSLPHGEAGAIDYIASTASTLSAAAQVGARSLRLVHDSLSLRLFQDGEYATVRFDSRLPWLPVLADYLLAAVFSNHLRTQLADLQQVEVWFAHTAPADLDHYEATFAPAHSRFSRPFYGFRLPVRELERPLRKADPHLHAVMCKHVAHVMHELPSQSSFKDRVATLLTSILVEAPPPIASKVAARLGLSTRTLARRLEGEGCTFYGVLDELRQRLALDYVAHTALPLQEIGERLGFTHAAAFHRAFRRWTGQTPGAYRKQREPCSDPGTG